MPIYENGKDREQQNLAAFQLERHIKMLGGNVRLLETPEHRRECYDFEIRDGHDMWTGVLEVKSRRVSSDQVEEWGSLLVEVHTLTSLRKLFYKTSPVTKKGWWDKQVVILQRCINNETCYAISIEEIINNWENLEDAPDEMMKDNHGETPSGRSGKLVPIKLWERFE